MINYLLIGLKADKISGSSISINEFDLEANKNKLVSLSFDTHPDSESRSIYLGKFDGRQEGTFSLKNPEKGIFIFVLEGAFEVQNRLLQSRDGLTLWNSNEIEFEALSNNAIILLIENIP